VELIEKPESASVNIGISFFYAFIVGFACRTGVDSSRLVQGVLCAAVTAAHFTLGNFNEFCGDSEGHAIPRHAIHLFVCRSL